MPEKSHARRSDDPSSRQFWERVKRDAGREHKDLSRLIDKKISHIKRQEKFSRKSYPLLNYIGIGLLCIGLGTGISRAYLGSRAQDKVVRLEQQVEEYEGSYVDLRNRAEERIDGLSKKLVRASSESKARQEQAARYRKEAYDNKRKVQQFEKLIEREQEKSSSPSRGDLEKKIEERRSSSSDDLSRQQDDTGGRTHKQAMGQSRGELYYFPIRHDCLSKISKHVSGTYENWPLIMRYNGLDDTVIEVNQPLRIPASIVEDDSLLYQGSLDCRVYKAGRNDTLESISSKLYGKPDYADHLLDFNRSFNPRFSRHIYNKEFVLVPAG